MRIKWYGHSCFELDFSAARVVTDPFDETVGYPVCEAEADIVTTSHGHGDHNYVQSVKGEPVCINSVGEHAFGDLRVTGISSFHDEERGAKRGENVIFVFECDGLRVAHLGDLGHEPDDEQYAALRDVDVMLIPVGGFYTIDTETALKIVEKAKPRLAIPMHFRTEKIGFPISDEKLFAEKTGAQYWDSNSIDVAAEDMDKAPSAVVLRYE